jgi:ABC-2 type transport system permease protein
MFKSIFLFELKQGFKKPATYIFFGIFFLVYLLFGMILSGVLPLASGDSNVFVTSASSVAGIFVGLNQNIFGLVNSVILVAVMSTAIQKDYQYNTHSLFFTKPIKKSAYFFGRFAGAYFLGLFVFLGQILGYFLGCLFGVGNPAVGPLKLINFLEPFVLFTMPNLLLLGVIFFALTTYTRNNMSAYLFCIILLVVRSITDTITSDIDNKTLAAILEPFGQEAFQKTTEYWTPEEQNNYLIPLNGVLLYNRILWLGIALLITFTAYFRFSFSQFLTPFVLFKRKLKESFSPAALQIQNLSDLPQVNRDFSAKASWRQVFYLASFEFKKMTKSVLFIIKCALGVALMFIISQFTGAFYGTETYPVTYQMLEVVSGIFRILILVLVIFFSGTVIWRDRDEKMDELIGTTPVNNVTLFFSKYLGMIYVIGVVLLVIMLTGIVIQLSQGYTVIEPLHYIKELVGFRLAEVISVIGLCLFIQVMLPNKFLAFFICVIPLFSGLLLGLLELSNNLYIFNSSGPGLQYSDMNHYGHRPFTFFIFKTYWLAIILLLSFLAVKFYPRGKEKGLKARYRLSKHSNSKGIRLAMITSAVVALGLGIFIHYNIKVLNKFTTPKQMEKLQADFEKKYKKYEKTLQPRIVESNVKVNIYPENRRMDASGFYYLKNKHAKAIDTLILNYDTEITYKKLAVANGYTKIVEDEDAGFKVWRLNKPIAPGDSVKLEFELEKAPKGFKNNSTETDVVYNGSFFNSSVFPAIGYNEDVELSENSARKKYGLKKKPRMADVNDSLARMNTYISNDADWIRFETVVSTSGDQIAIAPGYLQKEWKENGRNFYHYKMDNPILNFYSFLSARYEVKRDKWLNPADPAKPVAIEIYYQKGHEYNLDRMVKGIKKSLDYYTKNFSPYQHRQVRILEFPRYATFAQSFPNTIPFSEGIGFIAKVNDKDEKSIDYPFYVTAHEVGHQWWAHQVIGGNVQGGTLMSETMAQYSALMVMEKEYGKVAMKKFLQYEMNTYLTGRAQEKKKELPLMRCENQLYIHYNKGSVVMYALKDYIGEDTLNAALKRYIKKVAFQEPPYTNSVEFVKFLREATPDSLQYLITDMFETITVYENYIKDLSYTQRKDGKYDVKLTLGSVKFKVDSLGKQKKVPVADYVDVGIFAEKIENGKTKDKELLLKKVKMDKDVKTFEFVVDEKPIKAGIDPYVKLIDRKPDNNMWNFGTKPPKVSTAAGNDNMMLVIGGGED